MNGDDIKDAYTGLYRQILDEHRRVFEEQDLGQLASFIAAVCDHQRIFVAGAGREGIAARSFAMRLMHLGKEVHWIWDDTAPGMHRGDLFIAVNGSGNVGHINYVLERGKAAGADTLVLTGSPSGAASKIARALLFVPASVYLGRDPVVESVQPMGNLFEQHLFLLFDLSIMLIEKRLQISHDDMEGRHRNIE